MPPPAADRWWWLCYMGGGLLQLFGFFKNHSQLGPKSTRQYCISSKAPVTGQPGWPMTLTASHPARTMLSCTPPSCAAAASPVGHPARPILGRPHTQVPSSNNSAAGTCKKQMQHVLKAMPSRHMSSQAAHPQAQAPAYMQLCATCISAKNDCPKPSKHTH